MKKCSFILIAMLIAAVSSAQEMKDVTIQIAKRDYPKAKEAVDKMVATDKFANNAEAWYWKSYIYYYLSKDEKTKALCTDCRMDAFNAVKKYMELDPSQKETKGDTNSILYDIYLNYYDIGAKAYNRQDYAAAYTNFKNTLLVEDYLSGNNLPGPSGYKAIKFDTIIIYFTAVSARELKKDDEADLYFKKIIDAGIDDPKYLVIYEDQAEAYLKKGDMANWRDVMEKGKKAFPNVDYWYQAEIEGLPKGSDREVIAAKYEEAVKARSNSYVLNYNYAVELFNHIYIADTKPADPMKKKDRLTEVLKNTIAVDTAIDATLLMARHKDYSSGDLGDAMRAIKGVKPEDVKKKNDMKAMAIKDGDEAIVYAEKAITYYKGLGKLKASQKNNYKSMLDIISRSYETKGDTKKAAEYQAQKAGVDQM